MPLARLFEPIQLRGKTIKNRIVQPGQGTGFGHLDGRISERHIEFHRTKARGGVGLIIFEHTGIDRAGNVIPLMEPLIDHDRFIPDLRRLTQTVHEYGAAMFFQLGHGGRRSVYSPAFYLLPFIPGLERLALAFPRYVPTIYAKLFAAAWRVARRPKGPSAGPMSWGFSKHGKAFTHVSRAKPQPLTTEEIRVLVRKHAEAARRVQEAGADGVEVYCCHGYLLNQFYSPFLNQRGDEYGGDLAGRARFTLEVIREVRRAVGDDLLICLRLNGADYVDGGSTLEEAKAVAVWAQEAGADVINVTAGLYGSYPFMIPSMAEPQGTFVPLAEAVKQAVRIPVMGGIRVVDPQHAESLLENGQVDMVIMGRALLADPDMPNKARAGRLDAIRKCIGCNQCLEIAEGLEGGIHCLVNPQLGVESRLKVTPARPERVVVVGGGPAGMTAAETLARRGHEVILFEKNALGGRLRLMAQVPGNAETAVFLDAQRREIEQLNVTIRQEEAVVASIEALRPSAVIVATGGTPWRPNWQTEMPCLGMDDAFAGNAVGKRLLVWGDDLYCLSTALFLSDQGAEVIAVELPRFFPLDIMEVTASALYLRLQLAERGVEVVRDSSIRDVSNGTVTLANGRVLRDLDAVVVCKLQKERTLERALKAAGIRAYTVGDARWPRKSLPATCEAFELAVRL